MTPDIVIPVRPGEDNIELMYVLRSLKNVPHGNVHIIGYAPTWVNRNTVNVIEQDLIGTKSDTVMRHMVTACTTSDITEDCVLFNDDFYVIRPIPEVPILNRGTVREVVAEYARMGLRGSYPKSMMQTVEVLEQHGHLDPLSFELHTPLPYTKTIMLEAIRMRSGTGVDRWHNRTAYGALAGITGTRATDVKIYRSSSKLPDGPFVSTGDVSIRWIQHRLNELFPTPSPYEK